MIECAGYIVCDNEAIHGRGLTEDEAWADMVRELGMANVRVIDEPTEEDIDSPGAWSLSSSFKIRPASAALLQAVEERGGAIGWFSVNGVACTRGEEDQS